VGQLLTLGARPRCRTTGSASGGAHRSESAQLDNQPAPRQAQTCSPARIHIPLGQRPASARYTEPTIQLEYEGHSRAYGIRFCYDSHDGRFQRSPMTIDSDDSLEGLRASLKETPKAA
jgi:hypothetical protein